jgi:hypothetical protein
MPGNLIQKREHIHALSQPRRWVVASAAWTGHAGPARQFLPRGHRIQELVEQAVAYAALAIADATPCRVVRMHCAAKRPD